MVIDLWTKILLVADLWTKTLIVADFIDLVIICDRIFVSICCLMAIMCVLCCVCTCTLYIVLDEPLHNKFYIVVISTES